jgi:hypothetical protein
VAVVDAQVDRGDRDDGPAGNQARPPVVLTKALYGTLHGTRVA